ncbi:MAG: XAC2610-related protein [Flavobacterium sp.]
MNIKLIIYTAFLIPLCTFAQMNFKSVGTVKHIEFTFGFQHPKGAFVWYKGQKEPIALELKSLEIDSSERESGQPDFDYYKYTEMYNGKATGEYGITVWPRNVADIYYIRYKDGKKFKFDLVEDGEEYDGKSMVLLHAVQFHYYSFYKDSLTIVYPNGSKLNLLLNELDEDKVRRVQIRDYNFDGINDISFDVTSDDGLHVVYNVFIYNPITKKFSELREPAGGYFTNLKVDHEYKNLTTNTKSGANWLSQSYKFNNLGKLIMVKQ